MNRFYNETLSKLETAINELEIEADCSIQRMEAVHLILECLSEVKEHVDLQIKSAVLVKQLF